MTQEQPRQEGKMEVGTIVPDVAEIVKRGLAEFDKGDTIWTETIEDIATKAYNAGRAALEAENKELCAENKDTWQTGQTIAVCARQYRDCSKLLPQIEQAKDALSIALDNWDALTKKQIDAALARQGQ